MPRTVKRTCRINVIGKQREGGASANATCCKGSVRRVEPWQALVPISIRLALLRF